MGLLIIGLIFLGFGLLAMAERKEVELFSKYRAVVLGELPKRQSARLGAFCMYLGGGLMLLGVLTMEAVSLDIYSVGFFSFCIGAVAFMASYHRSLEHQLSDGTAKTIKEFRQHAVRQALSVREKTSTDLVLSLIAWLAPCSFIGMSIARFLGLVE